MNCKMQMVKFFILILIFLGSTYIGILISKRYLNREIELKELKKILNAIKTKIKFTYEPLQEIFDDISKNATDNISEILKKTTKKMKIMSVKDAWNESIEESNLAINEEDKNIIKGLGKLLRKNRCRRTS